MICLIFDSHAHYDDKAFDSDRDELLKSLPDKGVYAVVNAGTNIETSKKSIELSEKYPYIYASIGIHPECISDNDRDNLGNLKVLETLIKSKKVVAVGEIGLDYHYSKENINSQLKVFEEQLIIAKNFDMPVIIHDREAHKDTMELLLRYRPKGVMHCFSGSVEMANELLKIGMFLGIGGLVTFKNAKKIIEVVESVPLESLLLETDCPYMTPVPFRGKRCDSSYIKFTAEKIAEIKNISYDVVLSKTKDNAVYMFNLGEGK